MEKIMFEGYKKDGGAVIFLCGRGGGCKSWPTINFVFETLLIHGTINAVIVALAAGQVFQSKKPVKKMKKAENMEN